MIEVIPLGLGKGIYTFFKTAKIEAITMKFPSSEGLRVG
jgi:hypothetical protein